MRLFVFFFYVVLLASISGCHTTDNSYPEGGYAYLTNIQGPDSDYYSLPIRKLIPRADSMAYDRAKYFYHSFDEPNLSMAPGNDDVFRLSLEGFGVLPVIITITKNGLVVKQQKKDNAVSPYPEENFGQLTETEQLHYFFLRKFFPFGKRTYVRGRQLYIDSMRSTYPRLSDATYYQYLINKVIDKDAGRFEYTTQKITLTGFQFESLVNSINASGYWTLPYNPEPLEAAGTDGWGFCLEANTQRKYNFVASSGVQQTKGTKKLKQACQQILEYAKIDAGIRLWDKGQQN